MDPLNRPQSWSSPPANTDGDSDDATGVVAGHEPAPSLRSRLVRWGLRLSPHQGSGIVVAGEQIVIAAGALAGSQPCLIGRKRRSRREEMSSNARHSRRRSHLMLPAGQYMLRHMILPTGEPREVGRMVQHQIRLQLPMPLNEASWAVERIGIDGEGATHVVVAVAPRRAVASAVTITERAGVAVDGVIPEAWVRAAQLEAEEPSGALACGLYSGNEGNLFVAARDGTPLHEEILEGSEERMAPTSLASRIEKAMRTARGRFLGKEEALQGEMEMPPIRSADPGETAVATLKAGLLQRGILPYPPAVAYRVRRDRRRTWTLVALALVLVGVSAGFHVWQSTASAQRELLTRRAALEERRAELAPLLEQLSVVQIHAQRADQRESPFLAVLTAIHEASLDGLGVASLSYRSEGSVQLRGWAKDIETVTAFVDQLRGALADGRVEVDDLREIPQEQDHRAEFDLTLELQSSRSPATQVEAPRGEGGRS